MMKVCAECGEPATSTYCAEHTPKRAPFRARGYGAGWDKLSREARKRQPFCTDCGTTDNLTADHLPQAWQRVAEGKRPRLLDVEVVCGPCNNRRAAHRPAR